MGNRSEIAYCGLFCGACVIRNGRTAALSRELLDSMRTPEFLKLLEGLPRLKPELFQALKDQQACCRVLEAMIHLDCEATCRDGGGSSGCQIRECCRNNGVEGCWSCDDFETCEVLSWLNPVHGEAHRQNLRIIRESGLEQFLRGAKHW